MGGNALNGLFSPTEIDAIARALRLSEREVEVALLALEDLGEVQIAERLGVSPRTVHTHFDRLYRKLDVHSRPAMLVKLFRTFRCVQHVPPKPPPDVAQDGARQTDADKP